MCPPEAPSHPEKSLQGSPHPPLPFAVSEIVLPPLSVALVVPAEEQLMATSVHISDLVGIDACQGKQCQVFRQIVKAQTPKVLTPYDLDLFLTKKGTTLARTIHRRRCA
jgi:hypothetical protein